MTSYTQQIDLLPGEGWWGGLAADGAQMPFGQHTQARNLASDHRANQAAPFFVSNRGRYLWSEWPFAFQFQDGTLTIEHGAPLTLSEGHLSLRDAHLHAAHLHFPPSGHLPHDLLFTRPQYNTWIELLYTPTQAQVVQYAQAVLDHGFPSGVLMIDDNWMDDYGRWTFHAGRFPDPRQMTCDLQALGFPVMLWVCPFVSPDGIHFLDLERQGFLLRAADGQTAVRQWWNGHSAVLDLSHPGAVAWFQVQLDHLVEQCGVQGFKFDAGDPVFYRDDDQYHAASSPTDQCRRWAELGLRYPLNEFRASWKMGGQALAQRQRDKAHAWANEHPMHGGSTGLSSLIPDGLAQGLLGYPFTCPDMIGGGDYLALDFSQPDRFDGELFVRSAQVAALMPMMQFSAAPWRLLDEAGVNACREAAWLHVQYGETILELARQAAQNGEPIIRSLAYVCPDCGYEGVQDQFLLGNDLLVAPMLSKGGTHRDVNLPPGEWRSVSGEHFTGPQALTVSVALNQLPHFRRVPEVHSTSHPGG
ncbi:glycoside hydrolase [Deinococcus sp. Arct2-2]|uniref:glycoside hydrolase family 31 protein n=1 Tax=Deinococcus sp. Arct2-2 TaxID=2568653 RepID=UPI0010A470F8|nr:glycoside hydrolase family 31 protein [Deinococcus sp. Arct2-2]THF66751.1 glycoside hydrolase [Deinococcus sp. Arct2-2]